MRRVQREQKIMKPCVAVLIIMFTIVQVARSSNIFCTHEFAAAVVRACVRIRTARTPHAKASLSSVLGNV